MAWKELLIDTDAGNATALEDALLAAGAAAVSLEDRADQPLLEPAPGERPLWQDVRVRGLFDAAMASADILAAARDALGVPLPDHRWQTLEERDWTRAWMDDFQPMRFGQRLWVCPSWREPPQADAVNLLLDPGLAFGTGTHPTTALCLEWLDARPLEGTEVIDFGCGSGILAIAAALLGAQRVWAIDHDPQALLATRDNARRNGLDDARILTGFPGELPAGLQADVLVANILAGPLISLAGTLCKLLRPGGQIGLSGILGHQAAEVSAAYAGLARMEAPRLREDWVLLSGCRVAGGDHA